MMLIGIVFLCTTVVLIKKASIIRFPYFFYVPKWFSFKNYQSFGFPIELSQPLGFSTNSKATKESKKKKQKKIQD